MLKSAENIFKEHGGKLRMNEAIKLGMTRYMLYSLRDKGVLEQVSRGVFRLASLPPMTNPDIVTVASRFPDAVICLISALYFHEITTQIPHEVFIAVSRKSRPPKIDFPPISVHKFSDAAYSEGYETHIIDGVPVKIYCAEKTIVDCFKFRNKIGMDVVLEALKIYKTRKEFKPDALMKYAKICRVEKIITPYLELLA
ncbi:MAG TPA: type IV toxin-antitoxin system AbiEi family antitoxin domain-containing protein [bacterium]|nr:type IV toxin-antitoxin system AbiEi family antitoxin domain-containing protein [bacterium]HPS28974.1 type IV toxin-antitoxin system AbiEi family antitoxin domain-containing protein [bacterium]